MANSYKTPSDRHFSGINVRIVVGYVKDRFGPVVLQRILENAGESRGEDELLDDSAWSSYTQVRNLFQSTSAILGGPQWLTSAAAETPIDSESGAEMAQTLQGLGSPGALLQIVVDSEAVFGVSTIRTTEGEEVGPCEWVIRERFKPEFAPFREYCAFTAGMLSMLPRLFGLPPGEVHEELCCCNGHSTCSFRVRWQSKGDLQQERDYFETRSRLLEARLETLQRTVADLVSVSDPDQGLARVIDAAARALYAPSYVLVTDPASRTRQRLLSVGIDGDDASRIGREIVTNMGHDVPGRLVAEVGSTRQRYGWLAAIDPGNRHFVPQEREVINSYAGLAAAALDSATALEEARRQAATTRALLEFSKALSDSLSPDEIAHELANAAPRVIDCDRSMVLLLEPETDHARIAATHGYPAAKAEEIQSLRMPVATLENLESDIALYGASTVEDFQERYGLSMCGSSVAAASIPLLSAGDTIGGLIVAVAAGEERLFNDPDLGDVLWGLAGQGAVSISKARLIEQMRHQALHDHLTGLPNRVLVLDRTETALARARREGVPVGALFIDLDGFKEINDSLGHAVGDQLLRRLAVRFQALMREGDTIGRLGGDEFVALVEGPSLESGVEVLAKRLLEAASEPIAVSGRKNMQVGVTASIGIALGNRSCADELLRDADVALYRAKAAGKNGFVVYNEGMCVPAHQEDYVDHSSAPGS